MIFSIDQHTFSIGEKCVRGKRSGKVGQFIFFPYIILVAKGYVFALTGRDTILKIIINALALSIENVDMSVCPGLLTEQFPGPIRGTIVTDYYFLGKIGLGKEALQLFFKVNTAIMCSHDDRDIHQYC